MAFTEVITKTLNVKNKLVVAGTDVTTAIGELSALDGVTASADELNVLDGATLSTAELNILDGVTATAAELNVNAGVVAGTSTASKTAVLGANKNLDVLALPVSGLKIGAGAGTAVTASAAELNKLTGSGATVASGTQVALLVDASVAHALNSTFDDTEAEAALNALGVKINTIIDALIAYGIMAAA
jgi:hypothetical protein